MKNEYKYVPVEPTEEMLTAAYLSTGNKYYWTRSYFIAGYKAALVSAPTQPSPKVIAYRAVQADTGNPLTDWIDGAPDGEPALSSSKYQLAYDQPAPVESDPVSWMACSKNRAPQFFPDEKEAFLLCGTSEWTITPVYSHPAESDKKAVRNGGDFPEDFRHENGNYSCQCQSCGKVFMGHKRRVICKLCVNQPAQPSDCQAEISDKKEINGHFMKAGCVAVFINGVCVYEENIEAAMRAQEES